MAERLQLLGEVALQEGRERLLVLVVTSRVAESTRYLPMK